MIISLPCLLFFFFFFNDTATTEIYTLSLHDALPIYWRVARERCFGDVRPRCSQRVRSEEHTSELQSLTNLVCRLLLEKKKRNNLPVLHVSDNERHSVRSPQDEVGLHHRLFRETRPVPLRGEFFFF